MGMSTKQGGGLYAPITDINVTPLVDVMLVLLIIFMVTAPMLATGLKVDLPQAKAGQTLNPKEPVVVTVAKDGKLSLGADAVDEAHLVDAVRAKIEGDATHLIHLRGDKDVPYGDVIAVMDLLATHGLTHIALVSDPRNRAPAGTGGYRPGALPRTASQTNDPASSVPPTTAKP